MIFRQDIHVQKMGPKQKQNTPNKTQSHDDSSLSDTFSPIRVPDSPGLVKQGNLTGSARKLKDGAADLHNLLMKWKDLNSQGANIINEIANIKLEAILSQDSEGQRVDLLPESLLPLCKQLENLIELMKKKVVSKLDALASMSKGVAELERHNQPTSPSIILFLTWDVAHFEKVFSEIAEMYQKELSVKTSVCQNICHAKDRNQVMFYTAAWVHEPYIDTKAKSLVESMLLETRHKT